MARHPSGTAWLWISAAGLALGPLACAGDDASSCSCGPCQICSSGSCQPDPACATGGGGTGGAHQGGGGTGGTHQGGSGGSGGGPRELAPEKFIPSFVVKYCGSDGAEPAEETAKFDLIDTDVSNDTAWAGNGLGSWRHLKELNPDLYVVLYMIGPGEYDTSPWGHLGQGWDWMKANHGLGTADRWTARGVASQSYLQAVSYDNERAMILGNAAWQQYWLDTLDQDWWSGGLGYDLDGADGIFADNSSYAVSWEGGWVVEGTSTPDDPEEYFANGQYLRDKWRGDMNAFFARAVPWLRDRTRILVPNFSWMDGNPSWWLELDSQPDPPFAAMEECGFYCSWQSWAGCELGSPCWVGHWQGMVDTMASLGHVRALMTSGAGMERGVAGLAGMDELDPSGRTGWDALWFSLGSFMLGFDDQRGNALLGFTVWAYCEYHWLDEFDPAVLHLGLALGPYQQQGSLFLREFEDGWIVVNPTDTAVAAAPVPSGQARVIDHATLGSADSEPLATSFDLGALRAAVLLKDGHLIGNQDN